jgi:hypothetical protein
MQKYPWIPCTLTRGTKSPDSGVTDSGFSDYLVDLNSEYLAHVVTSAVFTAIYVLGFFFLCLWVLIKFRMEVQMGLEKKTWWFDFLFSEYSPKFFWWEIVMIFRRVVIGILCAIWGPEEGLGYAFIFMVLAFWLFLLAYVQPYVRPGVLFLEVVVTLALVLGLAGKKFQAEIGRFEIYYLLLALVPFFYLVGYLGYSFWVGSKDKGVNLEWVGRVWKGKETEEHKESERTGGVLGGEEERGLLVNQEGDATHEESEDGGLIID